MQGWSLPGRGEPPKPENKKEMVEGSEEWEKTARAAPEGLGVSPRKSDVSLLGKRNNDWGGCVVQKGHLALLGKVD